MNTPRHKKDTLPFPKLTYADQARSISATVLQLQRAIECHSKNPKATADTRIKCINQVHRLLGRLLTKS